MKSLGFGGFAVALLAIPAAASADDARKVVRTQIVRHFGSPAAMRTWGPRVNGRWIGGWHAPGGWAAYRPPVRGYVLPGYWINPVFYIGNATYYDLPMPARVYGWDRYEAGRPEASAHAAPAAPQANRIDDAAAAAATAAAGAGKPVEAMRDHVMQGHGAEHVLPYDYRDDGRDDVTYRGRWTGTWTGHYEGQPATAYKGTYEGQYDGSAPHWAMRDGASHMEYYGGPVYDDGYGWGPPVMTTITFQSTPIVTTTTTTTEETVYGAAAPVKRPARRIWKPRPKRRCAC